MLIGFVILSHGSPNQLHRLIAALDREYDCPPIACHHDFSQYPLSVGAFGKNVAFVQPHIATAWSKFSVVQAALAGVGLLFETGQPDWFMLLSASDYPIMAGAGVRRVIIGSNCDAFLDARPLNSHETPKCSITGTQNPKLEHFNSVGNQRIKRLFYTSREFWIPIIRLKPRFRIGRLTYRPGWEARHPYSDWPCYYGDHWFGANARVAKILLEPTLKHLALRRHLGSRTQADETYFPTVLMNEPTITVCLDNKRFAEWNGGGAHPMILGPAQLDEMIDSGAFFARKFQPDSGVLDEIDAVLKRQT